MTISASSGETIHSVARSARTSASWASGGARRQPTRSAGDSVFEWLVTK
ncbi:MAG: hypothetical protein ACODAE_06790 [Gemmatimonadota bacterium]